MSANLKLIITIDLGKIIKVKKGGNQASNVETKPPNIEKDISTQESEESRDKHEEYFFQDYNDAYDFNSFSALTSILPFKPVRYYTGNSRKRKHNDKDINTELTPWTLDSGASYHMTGNLKLLTEIENFKKRIFFPDGDSVLCEKKGTYNGYINNKRFILKNVLYVPVFKKNLMSIDCLSEQYYKTVFNNYNNRNRVALYSNNNKKVCSTFSDSTRTYIIWTSKEQMDFKKNSATCSSVAFSVEDDFCKWHRRFGHYNINALKGTLNKINDSNKCEICALTKLKEFPFPVSENKTTEPFERIHMDTVTIKQESLYGNKYIISILDDFTRFGWVLFIKDKKKVFETFFDWYTQVRNIFNKPIKYIRTDNGTEFSNNRFEEFCNRNGIIHEFSTPRTPQQNGRVERLHGTIISNARAMLQDSKLNHVFWEDAVRTSNYLHNRLPHKGNNNKIPFELLFSEKVDYRNLRVFGCRVFFLIPKQFRKKLDNTSLPGIFLGYERHPYNYRIYDTTNNKVIISRSVSFFEDIPGNCPSPSSSPDFINLNPYYESGGSDEDIDMSNNIDIFDNTQNNNNENSNNNDKNENTQNTTHINDNAFNNNYNNYNPTELYNINNNKLNYYDPYLYNNNNLINPQNYYYYTLPEKFITPNNLNFINPYYNNLKQNFSSPVLNFPNGHLNPFTNLNYNYGNLNNLNFNSNQNNLINNEQLLNQENNLINNIPINSQENNNLINNDLNNLKNNISNLNHLNQINNDKIINENNQN
eukprot:jgi/Orpsp1_1/1184712/evm.model.c7180000090672.1